MSVERPDGDDADPPGREGVSAFGAGRARRGTRHALGALAPSKPAQRGIKAALVLLSCVLALELVATVGVRLSADPAKNAWPVFLPLGEYVLLFWPLVAVGVSLLLPERARSAFWSTTVISFFLATILWGVTCAVAGTPRVGG